ncbi:MAG: hypothetical protein IJ512_00375 [Ruminococcus sp.]|nr:hypothetical protein [Ruminococcus sp.]
MMKQCKNTGLILWTGLLLCITGCTPQETEDIYTVSFCPIGDAQDMLDAAPEMVCDPEENPCYEITPDYIAEQSDYRIFTYASLGGTFLLFEGDVYSLDREFGFPFSMVTSLALADINADGKQELYFTFAWGSGVYVSQAGYFDPVKKESVLLPYDYPYDDWLVTKAEDGALGLYDAELEIPDSEESGLAEIRMTAKASDRAAEILLENGEITFKPGALMENPKQGYGDRD